MDLVGYCKCCGDISQYSTFGTTKCHFCGSKWHLVHLKPPFTIEDFYSDKKDLLLESIFKEYIEPSGKYDPVKAEERIQRINTIHFCKCCGYILGWTKKKCPCCGSKWYAFPLKPPLTYLDYVGSRKVKSQIQELIFKEYIEPSGEYDPAKGEIAKERMQREDEDSKIRAQKLQAYFNRPRVTCPYCGSQNTHIIHPLDFLGGFSSPAFKKQWQCGNCTSYF